MHNALTLPKSFSGTPRVALTLAGQDEQLRLSASFINLVAVAFFSVGVIAPAVLLLGRQPEVPDADTQFAAGALVWMICGSILHAVARWVVGHIGE